MPPIPPPNSLPPVSIPPQQPATPAVIPPTTTTINFGRVAVAFALATGLAILASFGIILAVLHYGGWLPSPNPNPTPSTTDFVKLGRAYVKPLGAAYAPAWHGFANDLRAGKAVADASKNMGAAWDNQRKEVFAKFLSPELKKIVPEGATEAQITPAQRAALADAYDAIGKGLETGP